MVDAQSARKPPRQARSRSTVDAILEAGQRVFGEAGLDGTTTRIAHIAGVSIGSLYQYFPGKESIIGALVARAVDDDVVRVEAAVHATRGEPLEVRLRAMLEASFEMPRKSPRFFHFMMVHLPLLGHHAEVRRFEAELVRIVRGLLDEHPEFALGDPDLIAVAGVGAVRGLVDHVARVRPWDLPTDALLETCVRLMTGYLEASRIRG
jgi:AcrR family transcriptional regulator